jgi:hypothetical protein
MYERAAKGYKEVDDDHEADIAYLQEQLSILATTDRPGNSDCQPARVSSRDSRPEIPRSMSIPLGDNVDSRNSAGEAHTKHRKRDFLLRRFKK